ncbi:MAG: PKD domain-containing protein [Flavobacteriaceae bacterium]|nr:PKD domain-containing protein [Flavobacteriaceae bacterium]
MKRILQKVFIVFTLLFAAQSSEATHMMGADFEYTCIGKDSFYVTVKIYKDCKGIDIQPLALTILGISGCSYSASHTLTRVACEDITPVCKKSCSKCSKSNCNAYGYPDGSNASCAFPYGMEKVTFRVLIVFPKTLSKTCCKFRVEYSQCCRNGQITTCCAGDNFYSYAEMDRCVKPCNSSPILSNDPVAILCAGKCVTFNNGAIDTTNYDSISYHLDQALTAYGTSATYGTSAGGVKFTPKIPMEFKGFPKPKPTPGSACSGFILDSITGNLSFTPTKQQITVIAMTIKEWRYDSVKKKMQVIGLTRRDMQLIVMATCNNDPPVLQGPFSQIVCAGEQVCFTDMKLTDPNLKDTVRVRWNYGIPKAVFTKKMVGRFEEWNLCWQTTQKDASTTPYFFNVTAYDDACPLFATTNRNYAITVKKSPESVRDYTNIGCGKVRMKMQPKAGINAYKGGETYRWTVPYPGGKVIGWGIRPKGFADTVVQFLAPGKYVVKAEIELNNCTWEDYDTVDVPPFLQVTLDPDTFVCIGQSMMVHVVPKDNQGNVSYYWNGDTLAGGDTMTYTPMKDTVVQIKAVDAVGCVAYDSMVIYVKPLPIIDLGPDQRVCRPDSISFDAGNNAGIGWKAVEWTDSAGTVLFDSQIITVYDSSYLILKMTDTFSCVNRDTAQAFFNPIVIVDGGGDKVQCPGDSLYFHGTGASTYVWINMTDGDTLSTDTSFKWDFKASTSVLVHGTITYDSITCEDWDTVNVVLGLPPVLDLGAKDQCHDYASGQIYLQMKSAKDTAGNIATGSYYWWANDTNLKKCISTNTVDIRCLGPTYKWKFNQSGPFAICTYTTTLGCVTKDSVQVIINPLPPVKFQQKKFCANTPRFLLNAHGTPNEGGSAPLGETWYAKNLAGANTIVQENPPYGDWYFYPNLGDAGVNFITYTFADEWKCDSSYTDTFWITPLPVNTWTPPSPICIYDGIQDMWKKTGAQPSDGVWGGNGITDSTKGLFDPMQALSPPYVGFTPVDFPVLFRTNRNGCVDIDTIRIRINPIPLLQVPPIRTICWDSMPWPLPSYTPPTSWWYIDGDTVNRSPATYVPQMQTPGSSSTLRFIYIDPTTGCLNTDSFQIRMQDTPWIHINPVGAICNGDTFQLSCQLMNATGVDWTTNGTGVFSDQNSLTPSYRPSLTDAQNGNVLVTATTTGNGVCNPRRDTFTLQIHPIPDPNFDGTPLEGCSPLITLFDAKAKMPLYHYFWNFGDSISGILNSDTNRTPTHLFENLSNVQRKYDITLMVLTDAGCDSTYTRLQYVTVNPWPRADFDPKPQKATVALPRIRFQNLTKYASNASTWGWEFGDAVGGKSTEKNPTYWYTNTDTGTYIVTLSVINEYGCADTIRKPVRIGPEMTVFIPNAFSPDNMGPQRNNNFWVEADNYKGFEIWVFNRWGEQMFYGKERLPGWNGIFKGHPAQEDVYVYQVNIQNLEGKWFYYSGTVTLVR